ncbi:MAG TPA: class A beta-lactamase-related serine hydrolase [Bryobacteraceae bacterium]|nr:class A beta-lactamase-related serine hydrolase [Bryobacteraceae bacterium]HPT28939.1 class A beta-lactamase-related serine hydrolase [Bryobacteraceae bacterium]
MRLPAVLLFATACLGQAPPPESPVVAGIRQAQIRLAADVYVYAKNLDTGAIIAWRQDEGVRTASTIKLPILAALYDKVAKGEVRWDETLLLTKAGKISGSGVLNELSDGVRLPIRDVSNLMIVVSDNTATNLILDRITADAVNAYLDTIGLTRTRSLRKVRGDGTDLKQASGWSKAGLVKENERFGLGVSTSREMVQLVEMLALGKIVSPDASKGILATLDRQRYKDGIGRRLGDLPVASKSGGLDALRSDVALVTTPKGRIAMAITVDGLKKIDYSADNAGQILIADLARQIVDELVR